MFSTYGLVTLVTFACVAVIESRLTTSAQYRIFPNYEQTLEAFAPRLIECAVQLLINRDTYGQMTRFDPFTCSTWNGELSSTAQLDSLDDNTTYFVQLNRIDAFHPPVRCVMYIKHGFSFHQFKLNLCNCFNTAPSLRLSLPPPLKENGILKSVDS